MNEYPTLSGNTHAMDDGAAEPQWLQKQEQKP